MTGIAQERITKVPFLWKDLGPHLIHDSLGQPKSIIEMASQLAQLLLQGHDQQRHTDRPCKACSNSPHLMLCTVMWPNNDELICIQQLSCRLWLLLSHKQHKEIRKWGGHKFTNQPDKTRAADDILQAASNHSCVNDNITSAFTILSHQPTMKTLIIQPHLLIFTMHKNSAKNYTNITQTQQYSASVI